MGEFFFQLGNYINSEPPSAASHSGVGEVLHQGAEAAAEFQKFLDHRGIAVNSLLGALARLQLGRAYVLAGDKTKARHAYLEFLELWKDADPDIPVLKQAKLEYAKLQ